MELLNSVKSFYGFSGIDRFPEDLPSLRGIRCDKQNGIILNGMALKHIYTLLPPQREICP